MHETKFISVKMFFNYVIQRVKKDNDDMLYRYYISDRLNILSQNKHYEEAISFYDLINKKTNKNTDNRTSKQIKSDLLSKINGGD